jgi:hypothetical protein
MAGPAGLPAESALQITHRISKKGAASSLSLTAESLGTGMQGPHIAIADRRMDLFLRKEDRSEPCRKRQGE